MIVCRWMLGVGSFAMAVLATDMANATVFTATYTGTITNGRDFTGLFGAANRDLAGLQVVSIFTYDTALGNLITTPSTQTLQGGTALGAAPILLGARVLVDGVGYDVGRGYEQRVSVMTPAATGTGMGRAQSYSDYQTYIPSPYVPGGAPALVTRNLIDFQANAGGIPARLDQAFSSTIAGGYGYVFISTTNYGNGPLFSDRAEVYSTTTSVSFAPAAQQSAVPESATWAMMVGGFGFLGAAARRRKLRPIYA